MKKNLLLLASFLLFLDAANSNVITEVWYDLSGNRIGNGATGIRVNKDRKVIVK